MEVKVTDEVVLNDQAQSQVEPATDQDNDITTWKKRLAEIGRAHV